MIPNKAFLNAFLKIALPVALQNMFISMLGIVDTLVIGQMGEVPIAAIGLASPAGQPSLPPNIGDRRT
jgi:Na+-driven multidrug efflux pump